MFQTSKPDPSLLRGMTRSRLGRRDALRLGGLSAMGAFLAACGVEGKGKPSASVAPDAVSADRSKATAEVRWTAASPAAQPSESGEGPVCTLSAGQVTTAESPTGVLAQAAAYRAGQGGYLAPSQRVEVEARKKSASGQ